MTVTDVRKDFEKLTMTIDADFEAPPERVWQLWDDPRQLERWWGPPGYPATFNKHDGLKPGAVIGYYMTTPEGDTPRGWWEVLEVQPPNRLAVHDGFADEDGNPNREMPSGTMRVNIEDIGGGRTRMTIDNDFPSLEAMEQLLAMGQEEGMREAIGQIDAILAGDKTGVLA